MSIDGIYIRQGFYIRQVFAHNLEPEFVLIRSIIEDYPNVSMDSDFPNIKAPYKVGNNSFRDQNPSDHYQHLKLNVNASKLIRLGLTFTDADGNLPGGVDENNSTRYSWQFNFKDSDLIESTELLERKQVDFQKNRDYGIESVKFAELLMSSGLMCNEEVSWIAFHSAYDFGYLVKMLTGRVLPDDLTHFHTLLKTFFGDKVYDVKHLMRHCHGLYGGLDQVAKTLQVEPVAGKCDQAGAHSLLTWKVFQKIKDLCCGGPEKHAGVIYGLGHL